MGLLKKLVDLGENKFGSFPARNNENFQHKTKHSGEIPFSCIGPLLIFQFSLNLNS